MGEPELVLYEPRGPQMWQPGCAAVGFLLGVVAIAMGQLGGIVLVVLFGLFLGVSGLWYRQRPDRLTLDETGFTAAHGPLTARCLWSDVARVAVVRGRGRPWVHIDFRAESQRYPWRKSLPGSRRRTAAALPSSYGMDLDELAAFLEGRRRLAASSETVAAAETAKPSLSTKYTIRPTEQGIEIIRPGATLSCFALFVGFWTLLWDVVTIGFVVRLVREFDLGGAVLVGLAVAVGVGFTVAGARTVLVRRSWVLADGVVVDRAVVPRIGEVRSRRYDVERIEMRTGIWDTGVGRTDELVFWTDGSELPVILHPKVENAPEDVRALGDLAAIHTRRPLTIVEQRIPEPEPPNSD